LFKLSQVKFFLSCLLLTHRSVTVPLQMMRGAEMLFAALFSVVFLGRTLNRFHLMGITCCMVRTRTCWLV
jgi:uncharacterized membrane protein